MRRVQRKVLLAVLVTAALLPFALSRTQTAHRHYAARAVFFLLAGCSFLLASSLRNRRDEE
jgi:hypothetical protein